MNSSTSPLRHPSVRYAAAIFLSSSLLFLLEPIAGKRLLPLLGGSAAVWTACLVFFQCALLLGYLAAHWIVAHASARTQVAIYVGLLVLSLGQLATAIDPQLRASSTSPITSVLWLLTILIGLPFVTLSATSPLLQAWYARAIQHRIVTESPTGETIHPYKLFAVSNVGSLLSLLIYPFFIEPRWSLREQTAALAVGFFVLAMVCSAIAWSTRDVPMLAAQATSSAVSREAQGRGSLFDRSLWVGLAACSSLLLSAVTTHLSQNVATIPLLWIIPLVVYLLTFVIAFGGDRWRPRWVMVNAGLFGISSAGYLLYKGDLFTPIVRAVVIFCAALFALCLFCHSELYRRRPAPQHLTTFYFFVAAGGALGATLAGVVAPTLLTGSYELGCGLCLAALLGFAVTWSSGWLSRALWFVVTAAMVTVVVKQVQSDRADNIVRIRNFYGTLHGTQEYDGTLHATERTLYHGVIEHGQQVYRADLFNAATSYYGHSSGVGLAIDNCCTGRARKIGVIGLGTGTLASYGAPGDTIRFYDLNPAVEPIARKYFTYLRDSPAHIDVVNGDARVSLAAERPQQYDVIAVDAFSGDAIPVHLITIQALELYRRHLNAGGIVAFHISNRYLDLAGVVQQIADRAGMRTAFISSSEDLPHDVFSSDWVLVTSNENFLNLPVVKKASEPIKIPKRLRLWTDDYNSLLPILRIRGVDTT
ncbi:MAG: fused MFS/spermidine synthase [Gemmatimonadaceae bacterium]